MKESLVIAFLCLGLTIPGGEEFPPAKVLGMARDLSQAGKEKVASFAKIVGAHFPDKELPQWRNFDGEYIIFWRRAANRPLPHPADPFGPLIGQN